MSNQNFIQIKTCRFSITRYSRVNRHENPFLMQLCLAVINLYNPFPTEARLVAEAIDEK